MMNRINVFTLLLAGLSLLCSCNKGCEKQNVVIIYSHDIGFGNIGANGVPLISTPNIGKLASAGIQSVKAPAAIQPSPFTIGTLFQNAGYKTGIIEKWHPGLENGDELYNLELVPGGENYIINAQAELAKELREDSNNLSELLLNS